MTCMITVLGPPIVDGDEDDDEEDQGDDQDHRFGLRVVGVDGGTPCARVLWLLPGYFINSYITEHYIMEHVISPSFIYYTSILQPFLEICNLINRWSCHGCRSQSWRHGKIQILIRQSLCR